MAITLVQSVTGTGATLTLNGVVGSNLLTVIDSYFRNPGTSLAEAVPTDTNGTFFAASNPTPQNPGSFDAGVGIFYAANCASGTHIVTPEANTTHHTILAEWSGMATVSPFDVQASGKNQGVGTSQSTGTTAAKAQAVELALISFAMGDTGAGSLNVALTDPVTNYTTLQIGHNDQSDIAFEQAYQILNAVGAESATFNWTVSAGSQFWAANIALFLGTPAVPDNIGPANLLSTPGQFIGWTA